MRNWMAMAMAALSVPGVALAQEVSYQAQLAPGEVVLNIAGSGSYTQRGNIVYLSGQMVSDAASRFDADALNQRNFDLLVNSLGTMGVTPGQIRKTALAPSVPAAGQSRSAWQIYVELYDQARLSEILSAMEGADIRSIQPPQYDVRDRAALLSYARQRAIEDAKRQAEAYATALTLVVRRIVRVNEKAAAVATKSAGNEGDVVATAQVEVDFVLGPMFTPQAMPAPGTP